MTHSPSQLERRLRELRYRKAAETCLATVRSLGPRDDEQLSVLDVPAIDTIWPHYISRLRAEHERSVRWPANEATAAQQHLDAIALSVGDLRAVWLALVDGEPVGIELAVGPLLTAGLSYMVTPAGDLMITARDLSSGFCAEFEHLPDLDQYAVAAWGAFALSRAPTNRPE